MDKSANINNNMSKKKDKIEERGIEFLSNVKGTSVISVYYALLLFCNYRTGVSTKVLLVLLFTLVIVKVCTLSSFFFLS